MCKQFDLLPINDTIAAGGTISSTKPINIYYVMLRGIFALYSIIILIWQFIRYVNADKTIYFFIYFTIWSMIGSVLYFICSFILTYKIYKNLYTIDLLDKNTRKLFNLTKHCQSIALDTQFQVMLLFWLLVYSPPLLAVSVHTHGIIGLMIYLDFFTSAYQLTFFGVITSFIFVISWIIFGIIFYLAGFTNEYDGGRYIYEAQNFAEDTLTSAIVISILISVSVIILHIILMYIKNLFIKCWINSRDEQFRQWVIGTDKASNDHDKVDLDKIEHDEVEIVTLKTENDHGNVEHDEVAIATLKTETVDQND